MPESVIKWLESDGLRIAAGVDVAENCEHDLYNPFTVLGFVQQGRMNILRGSRMESVGSGEFVLVRKFTTGRYFKTWKDVEGSFRMLGFLFQDAFIEELVDQMPHTDMVPAEVPAVVHLPATAGLNALMASLEVYFADDGPVDRSVLRLKTLEAMLSVVGSDPRMAAVFKAYAKPLRADLGQFMEKFITEKMTLVELAAISGRSLSTFNREFRERFKSTPHQWIKRRRLEKARELMVREGRTASEVYLETGFEDLAHFSRSFKQLFGQNPSALRIATG